MMMIVQMYKLQISVYHNESYSAGGNPEPVEIVRVNPRLPVSHEANAGKSMHIHAMFFCSFDCCCSSFISGPQIHLLLETGRSGVSDHTTLMIHKHAQHNELMLRMPLIDVDYCVAQSEHGWGLKCLKRIEKGDPTGEFLTSIIIQCIFILRHAAC